MNENEHVADKNEREREDQFSKEVKKERKRRKKNGVD